MALINLIGIDSNGHNTPYGFALISREDAESYTWMFEPFNAITRRKPELIFFDECPSVKKGINYFE